MTPEERAPHIVRFKSAPHLVVASPIFGVVLRPLDLDGTTISGVDPAGLERLFLVPEGHAVIDGEVVELCTRCGHDEWLHSITGGGYCIDACGCREFVTEGAPE